MVKEASAAKAGPTDIDTTLRTELPESRNSCEPKTAEIHVLAVDDSSIDRKVIERLLKNSAYKVTTVESGTKALEILGAEESVTTVGVNAYEINLIITDYCMPGMTGYDLLKKVKGNSALREIPVVIMSSENVPNRISRCLAEGAEEFLLKPVKLSDVKRLRAHVRQQAMGIPAAGHSEMACSKRKLPLVEGAPTQGSERRPRLNGVTVS